MKNKQESHTKYKIVFSFPDSRTVPKKKKQGPKRAASKPKPTLTDSELNSSSVLTRTQTHLVLPTLSVRSVMLLAAQEVAYQLLKLALDK